MDHANFSILMHRDLDTGEWYVERIDAHFENVRNQTHFTTPYPIRFAFKEGFVSFLKSHLPARLSSGVITIDEAQTECGPIGLNGMRIIAQRAVAGLQSVTIRIQNYVGNIANILAEQTMMKLGLAIGFQSEGIAIPSDRLSPITCQPMPSREPGQCQLE